MPVEKEFKWILDEDQSLQATLIHLRKDRYNVYYIEQSYIFCNENNSSRIRKVSADCKDTHFFTSKVNIDGTTIEIDNYIDVRDYNKLYTVSFNRIRKIRTVIFCGELKFEIDDLLDDFNQCYIRIMECEVDEKSERPEVPQRLSKLVIGKVKENDFRFQNMYLSDVEKTIKNLKSFKEEANLVPF